jgi:nitrogen fixation NifU-like protein
MTLYSKEILRRSKNVTSIQRPSVVTHSHRVSNPICGDRVECVLNISNQRVVDAWIEVKGCALCKASASVLSDTLIGASIGQVSARADRFLGDVEQILDGYSSDGEASMFDALTVAPARGECVVLPWRCIQVALTQSE